MNNDDIHYRVTFPAGSYKEFEVSPEIVAAVRAECGPCDDDIWCECDDPHETFDYRADDECECGVEKHHYHCRACGGVFQIG